MESLSHIEVSEICNKLGKSYPKNIKKVFGGTIHDSWQIEFGNEKLFLKRNSRKKKFLQFEAHCLKNLKKNIDKDELIIPKIILYSIVNDVELLLLDWIDMQDGDHKMLGKGLGKMHLKSAETNQKKFGYAIDGYIGLTNQNKGWTDDWVDCFINLRIKPQLSILKDNLLDNKTKNQIIKKISSELAHHKPSRVLVHGDLWSGNVGINKKGKGVLFDPASWWADNEVDIAMTKLFGGFRKEFYVEYNKIIPKKIGFEKRIVIYNFYHILNHANMFGGSYIHQVDDYVRKIINM